MKHVLTLSLASAALSLLAPRFAASDTRTFELVDGKKAVGSETFTRTSDRITGDITLGPTKTKYIHYDARIAPDGTISSLDVRESRDGTKSERSISVMVGRDSVRFIERLGAKADTIRTASKPGTLPFINFSIGLTEVVLARGRALKTQSSSHLTLPVIVALDFDTPTTAPLPKRANAGPLQVTFVSADTVMLGNASEKDKVRVAVGADGLVRGVISGADAKFRFAARLAEHPPARKD